MSVRPASQGKVLHSWEAEVGTEAVCCTVGEVERQHLECTRDALKHREIVKVKVEFFTFSFMDSDGE